MAAPDSSLLVKLSDTCDRCKEYENKPHFRRGGLFYVEGVPYPAITDCERKYCETKVLVDLNYMGHVGTGARELCMWREDVGACGIWNLMDPDGTVHIVAVEDLSC